MIEQLEDDLYEHGDGGLGSCPGCGEAVWDRTWHPECCAHTEVETSDDRDGFMGQVNHTCTVCHSEVAMVAPDEDGRPSWELVS